MKTHPLHVGYLVIGLIFLATVGAWLLREVNVIDTEDVAWLGPVALIAAGGVGLVAALAKGVRGGRSRSADDDGGYQPHYDPPLPQDYTSDIDRKLDEAERTSILPTEQTTTTDTSQQGEER